MYNDEAMYEDSYDDGMPGADGGGYADPADENMLESLVIVGLAAALVFLVMYRTQRQQQAQAQRRQEEERQRQQQPQQEQPAGGAQLLAPVIAPGQVANVGNVGDPNLGHWGAGGVGH